MIDRYNSKNSIVGTLYLTATHLIFVDPEANKETWVSLRGCSLTYQFHAILRSTLTSQFGWNIGFRFLSKPLMYGTRVNLELWNIEQSPIGFIAADPINVPRICIAIRRLLRESPRPFVLLHNEFMNFHKKNSRAAFMCFRCSCSCWFIAGEKISSASRLGRSNRSATVKFYCWRHLMYSVGGEDFGGCSLGRDWNQFSYNSVNIESSADSVEINHRKISSIQLFFVLLMMENQN